MGLGLRLRLGLASGRGNGALYTITLTNTSTDSLGEYAEQGDAIGFAISNSGSASSQKWQSAATNGGSPSDISGATGTTFTPDIGTNITDAHWIRAAVTIDSVEYYSAWRQVRYAPATAADGLGPFDWTVDDDAIDVDFTADFTTNGNTLVYVITRRPPGVADDGDGTISGPATAADSGTMICTATDDYGRVVDSSADFAASLRAQASAAGNLADQSFVENTGVQTYATAGDFTANGNTLTYSVNSVAGVSINPTTGVVSADTDVMSLQTGTSIIVTVTDEYDREIFSAFSLAIVALDETAPAADSIEAGTQLEGNIPVSVFGLTEDATAFWVLIPTGNTAPNATQVEAGQNGSGGSPSDSGSFAATTSLTSYPVALDSALDGTFDLYMVFKDAQGNVSSVYSEIGIAISAGAAINSVTYDAGGIIIDYTGTLSVDYDAGGIILEAT